jgi:hypothetical protein
MRQVRLQRRSWLAGSVGAIAIVGTAMTLAAFGAGASASTTTASHAVSHARPHVAAQRNGVSATPASHPVTAMTQEFGTNTTPFCPSGSGNLPCDGASGDYGTIDRVPSGFSNGGSGNYAPSTKALVGSWMALVSGTGDINQGMGCPGTGTEQCSGPFALFGTGAAQGVENVFPTKGFTVTDDLYLSPDTAPITTSPQSLIDDDVELNSSTSNATTGFYGIDNIITACPVAGGFVINFGNGSPGSCAGTPVITSAGWYRFVFVFSDHSGNAYLTESVRSEPSAKVLASTAGFVGGGAGTSISTWGGPGYFWLPTENISGLPLANFALQLGVEAGGHKP